MKESNTIFLAHASEDKPFVRKLYKQLKKEGMNPWLDEKDLPPGARWEDYIPKVIKEAKFFIVFFSKNSLKKTGYVQKELRTALAYLEQKPPNLIYLIPTLIDDIELPDLSVGTIKLRDYHTAKLFQQGGIKKLIRHLQEQLNIIQKDKQDEKTLFDIPKEETKEKTTTYVSGNKNIIIQGSNGNTINTTN